jgi:catechol 2,3-dioxygenase-like lactoylglutathione lyase family enzyme
MARVLSYRPNLEVPDVRAAADFLADLLGFEVEMITGDPPFLALVRAGEAALGLVLAESPGVNRTTAGYLGVSDVDGLHAECRRRGIPITTPLTDQPWGLRDFVIEIPGGHRLALGQRTGPPA